MFFPDYQNFVTQETLRRDQERWGSFEISLKIIKERQERLEKCIKRLLSRKNMKIYSHEESWQQ